VEEGGGSWVEVDVPAGLGLDVLSFAAAQPAATTITVDTASSLNARI
jgi:hypothetical protein